MLISGLTSLHFSLSPFVQDRSNETLPRQKSSSTINVLSQGVDKIWQRTNLLQDSSKSLGVSSQCVADSLDPEVLEKMPETGEICFIIKHTSDGQWVYTNRDILYMPQAKIIQKTFKYRAYAAKIGRSDLLLLLDKNLELINRTRS